MNVQLTLHGRLPPVPPLQAGVAVLDLDAEVLLERTLDLLELL